MPMLSPRVAAPHVATRSKRIVVVGSTGAGKTTLARQLARCLDLTHVELDALHWDAGWTPAAKPIFRERVAAAVTGDAWSLDGNYSAVRDLVWARADTVIWLDYTLPLILWRLARRTSRRVLTRVELWNGNRERLVDQFTRDSLFLWAITTYRRRRREYPVLIAQPEHAHVTFVHLRSPRATRRFLAAVRRSAPHLAATRPTIPVS